MCPQWFTAPRTTKSKYRERIGNWDFSSLKMTPKRRCNLPMKKVPNTGGHPSGTGEYVCRHVEHRLVNALVYGRTGMKHTMQHSEAQGLQCEAELCFAGARRSVNDDEGWSVAGCV